LQFLWREKKKGRTNDGRGRKGHAAITKVGNVTWTMTKDRGRSGESPRNGDPMQKKDEQKGEGGLGCNKSIRHVREKKGVSFLGG